MPDLRIAIFSFGRTNRVRGSKGIAHWIAIYLGREQSDDACAPKAIVPGTLKRTKAKVNFFRGCIVAPVLAMNAR